jgi:hypothetical protein
MLWKFRSPSDPDECRSAIQEAAHEEGFLTDFYAGAAVFRVRDGKLEVRFKRSNWYGRSRAIGGVILYNWYRLQLTREPSGGTLISAGQWPGRTRGWWVFAAFVAVVLLLGERFLVEPFYVAHGPGPQLGQASPASAIFGAIFILFLQFFFSAIDLSRQEAEARKSLASFLSRVVDAKRVDSPDAEAA